MGVKGPSRAGSRIVLTLPSIYVGPGFGRPKTIEGLHYLGPYSTLKGQGRAQSLKRKKN